MKFTISLNSSEFETVAEYSIMLILCFPLQYFVQVSSEYCTKSDENCRRNEVIQSKKLGLGNPICEKHHHTKSRANRPIESPVHTFAVLLNRVAARQTTDWSVSNSPFSPNGSLLTQIYYHPVWTVSIGKHIYCWCKAGNMYRLTN